MRTISVSTEVFAAIWASRRDGEDTEDAVLRRVLSVPAAPTKLASGRDMVAATGFVDPRFNVVIPPGFEVFRTYRGREYRAQAIGGFWIWNRTGYGSLNELSKAIGAGVENAWESWFWMDGNRRRRASELRDPNKIGTRSRSNSGS